MLNTNDIIYSTILSVKPRLTWALLVRLYTKQIVWYERGLRLAHYDDALTTVIYNGNLPTEMTQDNCGNYRYIKGQIVFSTSKDVL